MYYTKDQLIAAQEKWNIQHAEDPSNFKTLEDVDADPKGSAVEQINYLISLIDE